MKLQVNTLLRVVFINHPRLTNSLTNTCVFSGYLFRYVTFADGIIPRIDESIKIHFSVRKITNITYCIVPMENGLSLLYKCDPSDIILETDSEIIYIDYVDYISRFATPDDSENKERKVIFPTSAKEWYRDYIDMMNNVIDPTRRVQKIN